MEAKIIQQSDISSKGHAIECRINAEDPHTMQPNPGVIKQVHFPGGYGVRVDSHIYAGYKVSHYYDSLIAKIIVHAPSREKALRAMTQALKETHISGIKTNISCHQHILQHDDFVKGKLHTHLLKSPQQVTEPANEEPA